MIVKDSVSVPLSGCFCVLNRTSILEEHLFDSKILLHIQSKKDNQKAPIQWASFKNFASDWKKKKSLYQDSIKTQKMIITIYK